MKKERQTPKTPTVRKDRTQLGEVKIHYIPGPDAHERLRRAFILILSAANREASSGCDSNDTDISPPRETED